MFRNEQVPTKTKKNLKFLLTNFFRFSLFGPFKIDFRPSFESFVNLCMGEAISEKEGGRIWVTIFYYIFLSGRSNDHYRWLIYFLENLERMKALKTQIIKYEFSRAIKVNTRVYFFQTAICISNVFSNIPCLNIPLMLVLRCVRLMIHYFILN